MEENRQCRSMRRTHFVLGLSNNRVLAPLVEESVQKVEAAYKQVREKIKVFVETKFVTELLARL